jgi:hypothetical protein
VSQISLLKGSWSGALSKLLHFAQTEIIISSPFVTHEGVHFVLEEVSPDFGAVGKLTFITNLAPANLIQGATDPKALYDLATRLPRTDLFHLPRLHAKAYISNTDIAIITSGNLTLGGLKQNYEYGVLLTDENAVSKVRKDILDYAQLGARISRAELQAYCTAIDEAKAALATFQQQQTSISRAARQHFEGLLQTASDDLIRLRLAEGPMHTVFARTVLFLLEQHGPLSTEQLHILIEQIHPDLCDNTVDRVIDGRRYGKKWKHAVRSSQQHLKSKGLIVLRDDKWQIIR